MGELISSAKVSVVVGTGRALFGKGIYYGEVSLGKKIQGFPIVLHNSRI